MVFSSLFRSSTRRDAARDREYKSEPDTDKEWAKRYILDPLTAPEPSQETGLGTSHINPYKTAALSASPPSSPLAPFLREASQANTESTSQSQSQSNSHQRQKQRPRHLSSSNSSLENIHFDPGSSLDRYPTPPSSASPTDSGFDFHPSNPFSTSFPSSSSQSDKSYHHHHHHLGRESRQPPRTPLESRPASSSITPPDTPPSNLRPRRHGSASTNPYISQLQHHQHHQQQPQPTASQSPLRRHRRYPSLPINSSASSWGRSDPDYPRNQLEKARRLSHNPNNPADIVDNPNGQRRYSSIGQRFPGDMSHRPLDMIKRDAKAADRPYRHRKRISETDTIDALDTIGGAYHHGGPYDATLTSRNLDKKYSPVAAVEESNMEAIRATPRENIIDSLTKHVPLQGTSSIPAGSPDMSGKVMHYEEGADLMREPDAEGGAYKRWDGVQYHPDDLKGKGEPSFTIERDLKKEKGHRQFLSEADAYEMRPGANRFSKQGGSHQRSVSQSGEGSSSGAVYTDNPDGSLRRSHTTGKKLSEGLKRRFGSIRRKKDIPTEAVH